jgi:Tol biopolymer transport system component
MFGRRVGLRDGVYSIDPDGSRLRQVFTRRWGAFHQLDWSPDGSRIAFGSRNNVFTMRPDGRCLRRLTGPKEPRGQGSGAPAWSPDGKRIAFIRDNDVYVMRANGRAERRVVDAPAQTLDPTRGWAVLGSPTWQPLSR